MSVKTITVTEGELKRLIETGTISKFIAQENINTPLKFCLVGISADLKTAYALRHGRANVIRFWRLDNLIAFVKKHRPVAKIEVQLLE